MLERQNPDTGRSLKKLQAGTLLEPSAALRWLRPTDLPYRWWWGWSIKLFKTLEVLLFKILQVLKIYSPKKSLIAIPSFATRSYTILQAVVFNGTVKEVLGFHPRRLIHRLLRGVPDIEMFEWIDFKLFVSASTVRRVRASTETRGFVHLQLPWQLPWHLPTRADLKLTPIGIETYLGRVSLGQYEVLPAPVFFLKDETKWIVISDIDDTIKDSQIAQSMSFKNVVKSVFRGHHYHYEPIQGMAELYRELEAQGALIIYLTCTPYQLAPFLLQFLKKCGFPEGPIFMRWMGYGRKRHKWRTLHKILSKLTDQKVLLIGDSGEHDPAIYRRAWENEAFQTHIEKILIRHVPGSPKPQTVNPKETVYQDIAQLKSHLDFILSTPS